MSIRTPSEETGHVRVENTPQFPGRLLLLAPPGEAGRLLLLEPAGEVGGLLLLAPTVEVGGLLLLAPNGEVGKLGPAGGRCGLKPLTEVLSL